MTNVIGIHELRKTGSSIGKNRYAYFSLCHVIVENRKSKEKTESPGVLLN